MKLDWNNLPRSSLDSTRIVEGHQYWARFYRAGPHAIAPMVTRGLLSDITLHVPGLHTFGAYKFEAEVHFHFAGQRTHIWNQETPDFTLVIPIEVNWAWDAPHHPALEWLAKDQDYVDPHECDWSFYGIARWLRNGFHCPAFHLRSSDLLQGHNRALHYTAGATCANTFVVTDSINAAGVQIQRVQQRIRHKWDKDELIHVSEVVVGGVLTPVESFTVFSEQEMLWRRKVYLASMFLGVAGMISAFLLVRRFTDVYEVEVTEFIKDSCVVQNTRLDHWFVYIILLAVPWTAYANGSSNSMTGMPFEYQLVWYTGAMLHMGHELMMFVQVGGAVRRMKYRSVARLAIMSFMGLVHIELQIQFCVIAWMHGSFYSGVSLVTFILSNIFGELVLLTCRCPRELRFKARCFEVMHGAYMKRKEELESVEELDGKEHRLQKGMSDRLVGEGEGSDFSSDSGMESFWYFLSTFGDVVQCALQISFVSKFGKSPIMVSSITLTIFYLVSGYISNTFSLKPHE